MWLVRRSVRSCGGHVAALLFDIGDGASGGNTFLVGYCFTFDARTLHAGGRPLFRRF